MQKVVKLVWLSVSLIRPVHGVLAHAFARSGNSQGSVRPAGWITGALHMAL